MLQWHSASSTSSLPSAPPATCLPCPQITPDEYQAAREELRAIDARPIKKVVEAKARKHKRLHMRLTKVRGRGAGAGGRMPAVLGAGCRDADALGGWLQGGWCWVQAAGGRRAAAQGVLLPGGGPRRPVCGSGRSAPHWI